MKTLLQSVQNKWMITDFRRLYYSERTCFRYLFKIHESTTSFFAPISAMKSLNKAPTAAAAKALALCDCRLTPKNASSLQSEPYKQSSAIPWPQGKVVWSAITCFWGGVGTTEKPVHPAATLTGIAVREATGTQLFWGTQVPIHPPLVRGSQLHHP